MKWISIITLIFATSAVANEELLSWDLEIIYPDGTYSVGIVYLNKQGELVGTLLDEDNEEFVQAYGTPANDLEEWLRVNTNHLEL